MIPDNIMASKNSDSIIEQRAYIKFHTKLSFAANAIFEELVIEYHDSHLSYSRVCEWAARFRGGEDYLLKMTFDQAPNLRLGRARISLILRLLLMRIHIVASKRLLMNLGYQREVLRGF